MKKSEEERLQPGMQLAAKARKEMQSVEADGALFEEAEAQLANHALTKETADRIMSQYKDDQRLVEEMLEKERRRQAELMRHRLAESACRKKNLANTKMKQ